MFTLRNPIQRRRPLEAEAFYQGAHGVSLDHGLRDIEARFEQDAAKVTKEHVARAKKHEELLDQVRAFLSDAEERAARINQRVGGDVPQFLLPVVLVIAAAFMATTEVILLSPALDVLNIANPALQAFAAVGIVAVSSLAYHFAWESFTSKRFPKVWAVVIRSIALLVTLFLISWGILRGHQVAFAATLTDNPLGQFLKANPVMGSLFYVFITLLAPLMAATASHYSVHHLLEWREWKAANRALERIRRAKATAQKRLESERDQHEQSIREIEHKRAEWDAGYRLHHERGQKRASVQEPLALVYLKTACAMLLAGLAFFWAPPAVVACAVPAVGIATFLHFRRMRAHPGPRAYFKTQNVRFVPTGYALRPEPLLLEAKTDTQKPPKGRLP